MNKDSYLNSNEVLDEDSPPGDEEYEQDIVLLKYMAQRIYITLYLLDGPTDPSQPLLYFLEEGQKYTHRIAIYSPQALLLNNKLDFVGFISRKLQPGDPQVIEEIRTVDKKLIVELINTPGLMSYSSLELRDGRWCNLVLFSGPRQKCISSNLIHIPTLLTSYHHDTTTGYAFTMESCLVAWLATNYYCRKQSCTSSMGLMRSQLMRELTNEA